MRQQKSITTSGGALAVVVLALLAATLTGCGVGRASNKEKVSKTATLYLRALADGDTAKACAQLTRRARGEGCGAAMKERLSRLDPDALTKAADGSIDIDVHGERATAGLPEPKSARFVLVSVGGEWKIDSGYTLTTGRASHALTKPQYQTLLTQANARIERTETPAEKIAFARHASHARAARALERWADAEATNARILGAAQPPAPTRKANALLVAAERLQARDLRKLMRIVRATPGNGNVLQIAQRSMTPARASCSTARSPSSTSSDTAEHHPGEINAVPCRPRGPGADPAGSVARPLEAPYSQTCALTLDQSHRLFSAN